MASLPSLRVRHRRIHIAKNSRNLMSNRLCLQFLNIRPFFWQSVYFTLFELKSVLWKCSWTFLTLNSGQKKLYRFLPHLSHFVYHFINLNIGSHPDGITPKHGLRVTHRPWHPLCKEFSKFDVKPIVSSIFEYQTVSSDISPLYYILTQQAFF